MSIIIFPGHKLLCTISGLAMCERCRGAEGSIPTDCPGSPMSSTTEQDVYGGILDYRFNRGWVNEPSNIWNRNVKPFGRKA